jgi:hypothetical protein
VDVTASGRRVVSAVTAHRRRELAAVVAGLKRSSSGTVARAIDEVATAARAVETAGLART